MRQILDSGVRREFDTGAVRDIQEGKGRCDLMPLDIAAHILEDPILENIYRYQADGEKEHLYAALSSFSCGVWGNECTMLLEVSKHFEQGAKKYGEHNWQKGIPTSCYIDSAVRHYLKWRRGDADEPHELAFVWNLMCCMWTQLHRPNLNEYGIGILAEDLTRME